MQCCQTGGDLVLLAFHTALERRVDVRFRILDLRQRHVFLAAAKRIAGVRVLEFHHRPDVARSERRHAHAGLAVELVDFAIFSCSGAPCCKVRCRTLPSPSRSVERQFAELRSVLKTPQNPKPQNPKTPKPQNTIVYIQAGKVN